MGTFWGRGSIVAGNQREGNRAPSEEREKVRGALDGLWLKVPDAVRA